MVRARCWAAAALVLLVTVSCSGKGDSPPPPPTSTGDWERTDLKPLTEPVNVGDLFVLYVAVPGGIGVVGLDPGSGRTVWQAAASRAQVTAGVAPFIEPVEGNVVIFQGDGQFAHLVALDPRTGAKRWASQLHVFTTWPGRCFDDPKLVCASGSGAVGTPSRLLRFAADSGKALDAPVVSRFAGGREVAEGLFDSGVRTPEALVATTGASVVWERPLATVFPASFSTDNGWNLERIVSAGLFMGSVDGPPVRSSEAEVVLDLTSTMTAGFRIADGTLVWSDPGSRFACQVLTCPTHPRPGSPTSEESRLGLRTRATGTLTYGPSAESTLAPGANVKLEGFDLATGATRWSFDAGASLGLLEGGASIPHLGGERVVLTGADGEPTQLDLATGSREPAPPDTVGWCQEDTRYEYPDAMPITGTILTSFQGGAVRFPCDLTGRRVATPPRVPRFVGPVIGDMVAWSEVDRVIAVRGPV